MSEDDGAAGNGLLALQQAISLMSLTLGEDLSGREPVVLDKGGISECVPGKTVLITGAGGSIGSELYASLPELGQIWLTPVDAAQAERSRLWWDMMHAHHSQGAAPLCGAAAQSGIAYAP